MPSKVHRVQKCRPARRSRCLARITLRPPAATTEPGRAARVTLAKIREVIDIRGAGNAPCRHVRDLLGRRLADIDRQIADLWALRAAVSQLRNDAAQADPAAYAADAVCRFL
jgi:hypothetical protein